MIGENAQQMVLEGAFDVKGTVENGGYKKNCRNISAARLKTFQTKNSVFCMEERFRMEAGAVRSE